MSRKVFYKYNPATDSYEKVYPGARERWWAVIRQFIIGILIGAVLSVGLYSMVEPPREKVLRQKYDRLLSQYKQMGQEVDEAIDVMNDIAERDNNFYRVMLQADPVTDANRYAGIGGSTATDLADEALVEGVNRKIDILNHQLYAQIKSFDYLRTTALQQQHRLEHIPAIQPVQESKLRQMASGYGYRLDPVYGTTKFHEGMDFSAPIGTPVFATGKGTVTHAGWQSAYGNMVEIDHGYGYVTRFAHLSKINVRPGQKVERSDKLGEVGNTGKSTGPHLHYEVRLKGVPQNPVNYYFYDLTPAEYDEMIRQAENAGHVMD